MVPLLFSKLIPKQRLSWRACFSYAKNCVQTDGNSMSGSDCRLTTCSHPLNHDLERPKCSVGKGQLPLLTPAKPQLRKLCRETRNFGRIHARGIAPIPFSFPCPIQDTLLAVRIWAQGPCDSHPPRKRQAQGVSSSKTNPHPVGSWVPWAPNYDRCFG